MYRFEISRESHYLTSYVDVAYSGLDDEGMSV